MWVQVFQRGGVRLMVSQCLASIRRLRFWSRAYVGSDPDNVIESLLSRTDDAPLESRAGLLEQWMGRGETEGGLTALATPVGCIRQREEHANRSVETASCTLIRFSSTMTTHASMNC